MITRSSQIPASGEPPVSRYAIDGSGESIAPHEVPETHDSATSPKKGPGYSGAVTLKETVFEELPLADEEEGGEQRSFTDSLLVKTSPITETGLSDIPSPQIPVFEEPPVNPDSMTGSRDTVSPPGSADSAKFSDGREENAGSPIIPAPENVRKTAAELPEDSLSVTQPSAPEPAVVESAPVPGQESGPSEAMATGRGEGTESSHQPAAETTSSDQKLPPPSPGPGYRNKSFIAITAGILIILLIAGAVILYSPYSAAPGINQTLVPTPGSEQTLVPNPSLQPVSVPTQQVIQQTGVWVRVVYSRNYSGSIGIPGRVRDISGSSEKMYKLFDGDGVAQIKIHKEDNTGDLLTVELYREGEMIDSRKISSPMGSIEFMINTKTGLPPGITPVSTQTNNQTGSNSSRIVYF